MSGKKATSKKKNVAGPTKMTAQQAAEWILQSSDEESDAGSMSSVDSVAFLEGLDPALEM